MKRIAIYGKGGIGKSTTAVNTALILAKRGLRVGLIGCDPKQDTVRLLVDGYVPSILECYEQLIEGRRPLGDCVISGKHGVLCAEVGGPKPGIGCAGRGILLALDLLKKSACFSDRDVILFDVLGDVVCGGFAAPIVRGFAKDIYIVTSGEAASLYAANNILLGMCEIGHCAKGLVLNASGFSGETEIVDEVSEQLHLPIVARIPHDERIPQNEMLGLPTAEATGMEECIAAYSALADSILDASEPSFKCTPKERKDFFCMMRAMRLGERRE